MLFLTKNNDSVKKVLDDVFDLPMISFNQWLRADVREEDNAYIIDVEIPGFNKEDIKISIDQDYLTVEAEKIENKEEKKQYIIHERYYNKVERSFYVGKVDEASIKATYDNGILTINVPKNNDTTKKYIMIE